MTDKRMFIERRPEAGDYAVRRPDSERASAVLPTQRGDRLGATKGAATYSSSACATRIGQPGQMAQTLRNSCLAVTGHRPEALGAAGEGLEGRNSPFDNRGDLRPARGELDFEAPP
jgi:hypothetical protein